MHGHFGAVEHARLVHVVPSEGVVRSAGGVGQEELGPPAAHGWSKEVRPGTRARPAPAFVVRVAASGLDEVVAGASSAGARKRGCSGKSLILNRN